MPIGPIGPIGPINHKHMHYTPQDIINENLERRKALAARANAYNPITGEGCTGVRAHRQHPQRSTRRVAARHRSADLPGQADGSHKPRAAYAAHCTEKKSERQRAPPSALSAPRSPIAPPAAPAAPRRSKAPAHRSAIGAHAP